MNKRTYEGAKAYTSFTLKIYDWWVLNISNHFAWRCPTKDYLVPHFLQSLSSNHLDVGVGTGYYLTHSPSDYVISLMDLNNLSLEAASARVGGSRIRNKIKHDVFEVYPESLHNKFDSISMFYLLHCLPGHMAEKEIVIANAKAALTKGGVLYGATILGEGVRHNAFASKLMKVYNRKGIFSNSQDSKEELERILSNHFQKVDLTVKGAVALFSVSEKK